MDKYTRTEIKKMLLQDPYTTEETLNKYICQVFINCSHPEYRRRLDNDDDTFVCLLKGDSWEEVNNMFKEMNDKER